MAESSFVHRLPDQLKRVSGSQLSIKSTCVQGKQQWPVVMIHAAEDLAPEYAAATTEHGQRSPRRSAGRRQSIVNRLRHSISNMPQPGPGARLCPLPTLEGVECSYDVAHT